MGSRALSGSMPRGPRIELAGGVFHVYARGTRGSRIYRTRADRLTYLELLRKVVVRFDWRCMAYCLMSNHVHLLVQTPNANLARGMQSLHGRYAQRFNQRHGETGHLFERRYGSVLIEGDGQLWMTVRYIALNPVEAGISRRAEDYEWSSYRSVIRGEATDLLATDALLSYFAASGGRPLNRYRDLVAGPRF